MILKIFFRWTLTPFGFVVTLYCAVVMAWSSMLLLLLCNLLPSMCKLPGDRYACHDRDSPRRKWIEIDSQVLNALFCIPGFGVLPWRLREQYYALHYRLMNEERDGRERKMYGLRRLAGLHSNWIRLPDLRTQDHDRNTTKELDRPDQQHPTNSTGHLDENPNDLHLPLPTSKAPPDPMTCTRAPATAPWKIDLYIGCQTLNTLLQGCLCGFM